MKYLVLAIVLLVTVGCKTEVFQTFNKVKEEYHEYNKDKLKDLLTKRLWLERNLTIKMKSKEIRKECPYNNNTVKYSECQEHVLKKYKMDRVGVYKMIEKIPSIISKSNSVTIESAINEGRMDVKKVQAKVDSLENNINK